MNPVRKPIASESVPATLRRNISANYASQLLTTAIGIVMVPMYLRYMGTEAYGLIGLFSVVQLCIQSLDMGTTPTLTREAARSLAGVISAQSLRQLLRCFEVGYSGIGVLLVGAMAASAFHLAAHWVRAGSLAVGEVALSLILMTATGWIRWFSGLYRGLINGFGNQVWQSGVSIGISITHSIVVIPYLLYFGATPVYFFSYQLAITVCEFTLLSHKAYRLLPELQRDVRVWWQVGALRQVFHFSAIIALSSGLWVAVTQTDKVLLSKFLPLSDFGVFALATLVASGISTLSSPLSVALLPRLTELSARGEEAAFLTVYRKATQLTAVLGFSAAIFLALFSGEVLWVWTGNTALVKGASSTLVLYALGNGVAAFGAFPYYLQYAKGKVRLHLIGTVLFLAVLFPSVLILAQRYGAFGAGCAWLGTNVAFFLAWVPYVHRRLLGPFHAHWLIRDIGVIAVATAGIEGLLRALVVWPTTRVGGGLVLILIALVSVATAALVSSFTRQQLRDTISRLVVRVSASR